LLFCVYFARALIFMRFVCAAHRTQLTAVEIFNCECADEQSRFHIAMASNMQTKLVDKEESVRIDGLHVILEGLLMLKTRIYRRGAILGVTEFVCGGDPRASEIEYKTAVSLMFTACTYSTPDHLQQVQCCTQIANVMLVQ
jgi:hypothetical protein